MTKNFWLHLKKPILALAPMAGYTDAAFRLLCLENGADVVYTEMISAEALARQNKKTLKMLELLPGEKNVVIQLFGSRPDSFIQAVKIINKLLTTSYSLRITGIDINFGCPAKKITKNGAGSALMNELEKSYSIVKAVCENTTLPVSLKIRTQVKNISALQFINKVKDLPWTTVMIHGRSLNQGFVGEINYEIIKKIKQLVPKKIVLANGGVVDALSAQKTLAKTGADGLGLGRATLGQPWLFKTIKKSSAKTPALAELKKIILRHAELFLKSNSNLIPLRKHLLHYFKGQKNASQMRQKIIRVTNLVELKNALKTIPI
jgi:tRNA-dihydrouridine synthase B